MERTGLEDMMLRAVVMLLAPKLFLAEGKRRKTKLNEVCDYIDANLDKKITLTELERLSGHSARSLQYAFRSAFDRTPMQWVLDQRLEAVRRRILAAKAGVTLTALAADYFGNLGEFARLYKARYGELPSQTLQRSQARPLKT
jgi:transcriptional regulator GlxA family with amidase domain